MPDIAKRQKYIKMKKLKLIIPVLILFAVQLALTAKIFFKMLELANTVQENLLPKHEKLLAMGSFIVIAAISLIFILMIFRYASRKKVEYIEKTVKEKDKSKSERRRRNLEEQKRLSEIERQRNRTINNIMNGLNSKLDEKEFSEKLLSNIAKQFDLVQGIVFLRNEKGLFSKAGTYAFYSEDEVPDFEEGVGIAGQVAANKELINITNLPDRYLTVLSGLGNAAPTNLIIFPIISQNKTIGIVEIATFKKIEKFGENVLKILSRRLGEIFEEKLKTAT